MGDLSDLNRAISKIRSGSFEIGREMLERLVKTNPDRTDVLYYLGLCYSELGLLDDAERVLARCIHINPGHGDAYAALGTSLMQGKRYDEAAENFKEALRLDPENFFALANLGAVYVELGEYDETISCLTRANDIMPDRPQVLLGLALAYELKGEMGRAEPYYRRVVATQRSGEPRRIARTALLRIEDRRSPEDQSTNIDLVLFCLDALRKFAALTRDGIEEATYEIAARVADELIEFDEDEDQREETFNLQSLPGDFTGIQLLCYMYVGFRLLGDEPDIGEDLNEEFQAAQFLFNSRFGEA